MIEKENNSEKTEKNNQALPEKNDMDGIEILKETLTEAREKVTDIGVVEKKKNTKKSFNFSESDIKTLEKLKEALGCSDTEAMRRSIRIAVSLVNMRQDPSKNTVTIMETDEKGEERRVLFIF